MPRSLTKMSTADFASSGLAQHARSPVGDHPRPAGRCVEHVEQHVAVEPQTRPETHHLRRDREIGARRELMDHLHRRSLAGTVAAAKDTPPHRVEQGIRAPEGRLRPRSHEAQRPGLGPGRAAGHRRVEIVEPRPRSPGSRAPPPPPAAWSCWRQPARRAASPRRRRPCRTAPLPPGRHRPPSAPQPRPRRRPRPSSARAAPPPRRAAPAPPRRGRTPRRHVPPRAAAPPCAAPSRPTRRTRSSSLSPAVSRSSR